MQIISCRNISERAHKLLGSVHDITWLLSPPSPVAAFALAVTFQVTVLHNQPALWERPKAYESRRAISEFTPLLLFTIRFSVEGETPSFEESCLPGNCSVPLFEKEGLGEID
jgi:hypothetical protein